MNILYDVDQRLKARIDQRALENNPVLNKRRIPHGLTDNDLVIAQSCAMVEVALEQNEAARPLWVDIRIAWNKPGCVVFDKDFFENNNVINRYFEKIFSRNESNVLLNSEAGETSLINAFNFMGQAIQEWQQPDVISLNILVDNFVVKAFNGPINPVIRRIMGAVEYKRVPSYKLIVRPETACPLKLAVLLLSWAEHKGINLKDIDRERMGKDYDLVTSGEKPSTAYGRERKPKINEIMHTLRLSYIGESTIKGNAEKWYTARVIRGSVTEAASEYVINNLQTFEALIKDFDHIAGLR